MKTKLSKGLDLHKTSIMLLDDRSMVDLMGGIENNLSKKNWCDTCAYRTCGTNHTQADAGADNA